ncbi:hypothetical protein RRG08_049995 [Elysia crispata]|uniref:Uncharacterized protein n=1 Tax=Elysia crispata TaxID=231223 RepID=A0AAE1BA61_9GAST|nr:hypothetical protein RRG08_049995 [Elysia crispata]
MIETKDLFRQKMSSSTIDRNLISPLPPRLDTSGQDLEPLARLCNQYRNLRNAGLALLKGCRYGNEQKISEERKNMERKDRVKRL